MSLSFQNMQFAIRDVFGEMVSVCHRYEFVLCTVENMYLAGNFFETEAPIDIVNKSVYGNTDTAVYHRFALVSDKLGFEAWIGGNFLVGGAARLYEFFVKGIGHGFDAEGIDVEKEFEQAWVFVGQANGNAVSGHFQHVFRTGQFGPIGVTAKGDVEEQALGDGIATNRSVCAPT